MLAHCRGGAPLPPARALSFPLPADMPPPFYRGMASGQGLSLAQLQAEKAQGVPAGAGSPAAWPARWDAGAAPQAPPRLVPVHLEPAGAAGPAGAATLVSRSQLQQAADIASLLDQLVEQCGAPPGRQWQLLCSMEPGGPPARVAAAVPPADLLAEARSLVLREVA